MQHYDVDIAPAAADQIREAFYYIYERSPQNGQAWLRKLYQKMESLETLPHRCGAIREYDAFEEDVRELLHFSHRVIFTVDEDDSTVKVHAVRHAAQDELQGDEF